MVEQMARGEDGKFSADALEAGDDTFSALARMNSEQLNRQLSLSFLDSDEMNDMVRELRIEDDEAKKSTKNGASKRQVRT